MNEEMEKTSLMDKYIKLRLGGATYRVRLMTLLLFAAALEKQSEHPFAKAILQKAQGLSLPEVQDFETLPGRGICGIIGSVTYYGGNRRLMEEQGIPVPEYPHKYEDLWQFLRQISGGKEQKCVLY